ncbi:MAG: nucleotide exchange factor GrpE [Bacteroidetes bacterium]|nr:nucleotide exchange factor GrpE [Bacteroidota bacterium]MBU1116313.1 nucleotide exchange factor GrpE [Bacteroidota bacterium]MBU1798301.1 nucleotide exchange factor GrpE [Bacteroidota bacterium]
MIYGKNMKKNRKDEKKVIDIEVNEKEEIKAEEKAKNGDEPQVDSNERIAELEKKNEELNDRLIRRLAEFENYKKRTDVEKEELFKYAAQSFILKTLAVHEDLQRSLAHIDDENIDALKQGLKLVADKFTQILTEQGVTKIDAMGKEFDHEYHEALLQQPSNDFPVNTVLSVVESGYMYKDKVLKHAKVIVSREVEEEVTEENNSEE